MSISEDFSFIPFDEKKLKQEIEFNDLLAESESSAYISNLQQPRKTAKKVRVSYLIGARGGGKTTALEEDAEDYFNEGLSNWYIWGSRSNENVFVAVNEDCKHRWDKAKKILEKRMIFAKNHEERQKYQRIMDQLDERLHCNCSKAYPINWLVPSYWDFKGVKQYNNNWSGKDEYIRALEKEWISKPYHELTLKQREDLENRNLPKPKWLQKELIRICPFTVPLNAKDKAVFEQEFLKYAFEAREEHRWLIMNPLMFLDEKHKFSTIGHIFDKLKVWVDQYWQPLTPQSVGKLRGIKESIPKEEWSKQEKSHDKICLILPEIRTLAPPNKFSPEKQSTMAKRPMIDILPEMRHLRIWLIGDLQAYNDLNDSVRPMSDYVIIKRANRELLGDEWNNFVNKIEQLRKERLLGLSHGKFDDFKTAPYEFKKAIDKDLPSVSEIPKNRGYVVYGNGEFYLEKFGMASFHHKSESETVQSVTGITWTLRKDMGIQAERGEEQPDKSTKRLKNYDENKVMKYLTKSYILYGNWETAQINYNNLIKDGTMPSTSMATMPTKSLSTKIRRVPELAEKIDFAKSHPDKPRSDLIKGLD